jgi:hypothetical protein
MSKKNQIEKETRRLIEGISDLVKKKGEVYKFRTKKKKQIRRIKRTCVHWTIRKGKPIPCLTKDSSNDTNWRCSICNAVFPISPMDEDDFNKVSSQMLGHVNQAQMIGVKMGGDAEDTKLFLRLRGDLPRFQKIRNRIVKRATKIQHLEEQKNNSDSLSQFDSFSGYTYR